MSHLFSSCTDHESVFERRPFPFLKSIKGSENKVWKHMTSLIAGEKGTLIIQLEIILEI